MQELLPVLLGAAASLLCCRIGSARARALSAILLSLVGGALSTTINGEWGAGVADVLIDMSLALAGAGAALATLAVLSRIRRRAAQGEANS